MKWMQDKQRFNFADVVLVIVCNLHRKSASTSLFGLQGAKL